MLDDGNASKPRSHDVRINASGPLIRPLQRQMPRPRDFLTELIVSLVTKGPTVRLALWVLSTLRPGVPTLAGRSTREFVQRGGNKQTPW
jgi:hypothetical protein